MIVRHGMRSPAGSAPDDGVVLLERIAREVRTGSSLAIATRDALRDHPRVLPGVASSLDDGDTVATALGATTPHAGDEAMLAQALSVAATAGPAAATALDRAAQVLRERRSWRLERDAAAAQARLSARVLTVVPVATGAWMLLSSERVREAFRSSSLPMIAVMLGILLDLAGWWWMRRLVDGPAHLRSTG